MKRWLKNMIALGFLILFLPYTITLLLNGKQGIHKEEALPQLEYQVLNVLMQEDTSWMQESTLDLLAILCRTECVRQGEEPKGYETVQELYGAQYERLYQAVVRTQGRVITIENEYKELPYHAVSAGVTRDGRLLGEEFSYVTTDGSNLLDIERTLELPEKLKAPVKKGSYVGRVVYSVNKKDIGSPQILTAGAVEQAGYKDYLQQTFRMYLL